VINDVLRHQLKIRGKCECPKYTYFDMPLLMESLVETAGPNDWHAAWGPDWAHVWKTITAEMKLSDMFALKMFEIMAEVHPGPTTGVLISGTQKRVVVFEFIVEGDWWRPWNEVGEGFFVHRFTEEDMQKEVRGFFSIFSCTCIIGSYWFLCSSVHALYTHACTYECMHMLSTDTLMIMTGKEKERTEKKGRNEKKKRRSSSEEET
jgi:hypothetical protein